MNLAIGLSNFYHSMSTQIDGLDFFRFCLIEIVRKNLSNLLSYATSFLLNRGRDDATKRSIDF
jgi:hypothetical protein